MKTHKKPKYSGDHLYDYVMWFLNGVSMEDDLYLPDVTCNIEQVVKAEQCNIDQQTGTSINEVIGGDFSEQVEWPVVNGVIRRYGYSV